LFQIKFCGKIGSPEHFTSFCVAVLQVKPALCQEIKYAKVDQCSFNVNIFELLNKQIATIAIK
jgi:hypothetical protein